MATPRLGLRFLSQTPLARNIAFRQPAFRQTIARRTQTTTATTPNESGFARFWNSNVGPKTVHFWAPVMKWGLVLAGVSDFARPASSLSMTQNFALMCTGAIWTRWCFVIKPRNLFLAAVNFFLFCVGATQVARITTYNQSLKHDTLTDEVKAFAKEEAAVVKGFVKDPKAALENVKNP